MNSDLGVIDPTTTYRLMQPDHAIRRHHTPPTERRGSGRRSVARGLRRVADLIDG